jgi:ATP-dependent RNA helicase RhlB
MIKKLLKKLFGAKDKKEKGGGASAPPKQGPARSAAEHRERQPRAQHTPREAAEPQRRERVAPAGGGPAAAEAKARDEKAKPARRRRRGGRGRGSGTAGASQQALDADRSAGQRQAAPAETETPAPAETGAKAAGRRRRRKRRPEAVSAPPAQGLETEGPAIAESAEPEPRPRAPERAGRGLRGDRERPRREHVSLEPIALPVLPPLPPWTPPADPTRFAAYDLPPEVQAGIVDAGFVECTPVQARVLPLSLQGKDVAAQSQTGTGKTAAFLITIFTQLLRRGPVAGPKPRALVIAPTRELAVQIESDARQLGAHTGLTAVAIFGGVDYEKQRQALRLGADLVVGTPGRLIDYLKQGAWRPEGVELLVIDEADRMFDMGFVRDLRYILQRLPHFERRQTMLFSATLNYSVTELTYEYMHLPEEIRATPARMTAERAEEVLHHVSRDEKPALLLGIMARERPERTMIFTNTKAEAEKVAKLLEHHGLRARGITGNLEQARRLKLMEEFKSGTLPIMVATDVASRGLHIEGVTHVINWDLPQDPEDYVHRIGRTARAGAVGRAISLADESGALNLEAIEKLIGYKIPVVWHEQEHLAEVRPGWREAAARERRERERELEARGIKPRGGPRGGPAPGRRGGSRPGGARRRG